MMALSLLSIALCFIPLAAVFLGIALLAKDFKIRYGLFACALGLAAVIPIAVIQVLSQDFFEAKTLGMVFIRALLFNGLIEESIKTLIFFLMPAKKLELKNFFHCAVLSGMALACFESLLYLISGYEHIGLRMGTAVIIHAVCGGLGGLFVYSVKAKQLRIFPFLYAVMLHGIYNYFAGLGRDTVYFYLAFAVILLAIAECRVQYLKIKTCLYGKTVL